MSTHDLDQLRRRLPDPNLVEEEIACIQRLADWLATDALARLRRIAGESPRPLEEGAGLGHHDAYPPGGSSGRGSKGSHADPTAARVEHDAGGRGDKQPDTWKRAPDPTGDAIVRIFAMLAVAADAAATIHGLDHYVDAARSEQGKRPVSLAGDCGACGRPVAGTSVDKLVSGFCGACRKAWERAGYPDRSEFAATRRRALNDNDGTAA